MYRKDFTQLTPAERTLLADGFNHLWSTGYMQSAAALHNTNFNGGRIHWCPSFLPWHRDFLRKLELALQAFNPAINLPYWDWTRGDSRNIDIAPWKATFGGRNNTGGEFDSWTYTRRSTGGSFTLPTLATIVTELQAGSYAAYRTMETGSHTPGHNWIGNTMASGESPLDPFFFLHHCNLDRLWAIWQQNNPSVTQYTTTPIGSDSNSQQTGLNASMVVGTTATPASVLDHTALGYKYERDILLEIAWYEAHGTHLTTGDPRPADLLIRDSATDTGAYPSPVPHWTSPDIWVRNEDPSTPGEDPNNGHQSPIVNAVNYLYVNVKNNGTAASSGNNMEAFHCNPGTGMMWPSHFTSMGTLPIPGSIAPGATVRVGPFLWTPTVVDHECLLAIANTSDDPQSAPMFYQDEPHWKLVRFENSVGQRNVSPIIVKMGGKMKSSFRVSGGNVSSTNILQLNTTDIPMDTAMKITVPNSMMNDATLTGMSVFSTNTRFTTLQLNAGVHAALAGFELEAGADRTVKLEVDFSISAVHEQIYPLIAKQVQNGEVAGSLTIEFVAIKDSEDYVYGNPRSKELHITTCPYWNKIAIRNKIPFGSIREGQLRGYNGCAFCLSDYNTG